MTSSHLKASQYRIADSLARLAASQARLVASQARVTASQLRIEATFALLRLPSKQGWAV